MSRTKRFAQDFKAFAFSDNLLKVAVAFVMASAFVVLTKAFVDSFIMPLIAAITGDVNFDQMVFTVNGSDFTYGTFISALITFVLIAFVMFLVVRLAIRVMGEKAEVTSCPACMEDVSIAASRCPHCTSELTPATQ